MMYLKKFLFFHNVSNYDYHFIIKELAEEFEEQFNCLGENTEKYVTFSVPIKNEVTRINKKRKENHKTIFYRLQFIDSTSFMASLLSSLVNNLVNNLLEFIKLNLINTGKMIRM